MFKPRRVRLVTSMQPIQLADTNWLPHNHTENISSDLQRTSACCDYVSCKLVAKDI